jgi:7-cyano-7-deazaguanine reductase
LSTPAQSPLGRSIEPPRAYDPGLLFAIARAPGRAELRVPDPAPFHGVDIWNAYEIAWLDARGKPRVAIGEFRVPADSPNIVESKSLKLYLNSLAGTRFDNPETVRSAMGADLSAVIGCNLAVLLRPPTAQGFAIETLQGDCIDDLPLGIDHYGPPRPELLVVDDEHSVEETLVSHLLKSNCPVTGQPDWASLQIRYSGPRLDRAGLLRYLIGFRDHAEFHEQCVERIFMDLWTRTAPAELGVYARFTRRGGIDINPFRTSVRGAEPENPRLARQ